VPFGVGQKQWKRQYGIEDSRNGLLSVRGVHDADSQRNGEMSIHNGMLLLQLLDRNIFHDLPLRLALATPPRSTGLLELNTTIIGMFIQLDRNTLVLRKVRIIRFQFLILLLPS
jgi:hypothetical protein